MLRSICFYDFCLVCIVLTLNLPASLLAGTGNPPRSAPQDYYALSTTSGLPETIARNTIFAELGGNGVVLSLNYERLIFSQMGIRVGAGICSIESNSSTIGKSFPLMLNYYLGTKYKLELGAGVVFLANFQGNKLFASGASPLLGFTLGHKYQPLDGGFTLRASLTPFYSPSQNHWALSGGLSFGHSF
jgi:hypothetical protein